MKKFFYISFFCLLFISISSAFGQSRKELERRRKKLHREIKRVERILSQTEKKKTNALDDLKDLNQKITVRERLIETIELEAKELTKEIEDNQQKIRKNNEELKVLKVDYGNMVFKSYKSKSQKSKTMFLLSSKSFHQAYKRLKYMEQYKKFRQKQGEAIIVKTKEIEVLNDSLKKIKKVKNQLIISKEREKRTIEFDRKNQEKIVFRIKRQEHKYKRELQEKIREEKRIVAKIDKIIREAIAKSNKNKKGKVTKDKLFLSAEEKVLKAKFEQNKGVLPWPIKNGVITRKFGVQRHPTFKSININSTGLHIRGREGDEAKSVFTGKVLVVQLLSKGRKSVFIQHGNYITVYNNLDVVYVKKGQQVKTGQKLGRIFTDKITGKTSLGFVLSKNTKKLNPAKWIKKK